MKKLKETLRSDVLGDPNIQKQLEESHKNKILIISHSDVMNGLITAEKRLDQKLNYAGQAMQKIGSKLFKETDKADDYEFVSCEVYPYEMEMPKTTEIEAGDKTVKVGSPASADEMKP